MKVVLLNSTNPQLPAYLAHSAGLQAAVVEHSGVPVEVFDETIDVQRFGQARLEKKLLSLLKQKYQDLQVDVVVAISAVALRFAERYGEEIWPEADIVFSSVSSDSPVDIDCPGAVTSGSGRRQSGIIIIGRYLLRWRSSCFSQA